MAFVIIDSINIDYVGDNQNLAGSYIIFVRMNLQDVNSLVAFIQGDGGLLTITDITNISNDRIYIQGDVIRDYCNGDTRVTIKASNQYPFAYADVEYNSAFCGSQPPTLCKLFLDRVDTVNETASSASNGTADIIPTGYNVNDVLEFSLDNSTWQSSNEFLNLAPGNYTAYVRDQNGCISNKAFTIYAFGTAPFSITKIDTTDESDEGLKDGTAKIYGSGLGNPYTYSLDNITFQSSDTFSNLFPSSYVAYLKNTSGTVVSLVFEIKQFNGFVVQRPLKKLGNNISRWDAVFNPIIFKFRRRDWLFLQVVKDIASNKPKLIFSGFDGITIGNYINVISEVYNGSFQVIEVGSGYLIIDTNFKINTGAGYIIVSTKVDYKIEFELITGINDEKITGFYSSDSKGLITAAIQKKLKPFLKAINTFKYNAANQRDLNAASSFRMRYRETWEGFVGLWTNEDSSYHFVNSAKQLGETYGGNLLEYVTFLENSTAKFLSGFKSPTFFNGYPFDLSFIYSENILGTAIFRNDNFLDVNKASMSSSASVLASETNVAFLNSDNSLILIETPSVTNQGLTQSIGVHRLMINQNFPTNAKYNSIKLTWSDAGTIKPITETKFVKINDDCRKVPVYLCWLNTLGGWDYWLFDVTQKSELGTNNQKTFEKYVEDFENGDGFTETLSKDAQVKITLGDNNISLEDYQGIKGVLYSPKVQMLYSQTPLKWFTVQVDAKSFSYETDKESTDIEFSIVLPNINIQTQ